MTDDSQVQTAADVLTGMRAVDPRHTWKSLYHSLLDRLTEDQVRELPWNTETDRFVLQYRSKRGDSKDRKIVTYQQAAVYLQFLLFAEAGVISMSMSDYRPSFIGITGFKINDIDAFNKGTLPLHGAIANTPYATYKAWLRMGFNANDAMNEFTYDDSSVAVPASSSTGDVKRVQLNWMDIYHNLYVQFPDKDKLPWNIRGSKPVKLYGRGVKRASGGSEYKRICYQAAAIYIQLLMHEGAGVIRCSRSEDENDGFFGIIGFDILDNDKFDKGVVKSLTCVDRFTQERRTVARRWARIGFVWEGEGSFVYNKKTEIASKPVEER